MTYGLTDYWNDPDQNIAEFDELFSELIEAETTPVDRETYHLLRKTICAIQEHGRAIDNTLWPGEKIRHGNAMDTLPIETYGESQVPFIKGPLSLAFCEFVYLPHLARFDKVKFNPILVQLSKLIGTDLEKKKADTREVVEKLRKTIIAAKENIDLDPAVKPRGNEAAQEKLNHAMQIR